MLRWPGAEDVLRAVAGDRTGTDLEAGHLATSMDQRLDDAGAECPNYAAVVTSTDGRIESEERN